MKPDHVRALDILISRCGQRTVVTLRSGDVLDVVSVAWGRDLGEEVAHVTTNISPGQAREGCSIEFFRTDEVIEMLDPFDGRVLFAREAGSE